MMTSRGDKRKESLLDCTCFGISGCTGGIDEICYILGTDFGLLEVRAKGR